MDPHVDLAEDLGGVGGVKDKGSFLSIVGVQESRNDSGTINSGYGGRTHGGYRSVHIAKAGWNNIRHAHPSKLSDGALSDGDIVNPPPDILLLSCIDGREDGFAVGFYDRSDDAVGLDGDSLNGLDNVGIGQASDGFVVVCSGQDGIQLAADVVLFGSPHDYSQSIVRLTRIHH